MSAFEEAVEGAIAEATGVPFRIAGKRQLGGGCINAASCVTGKDGRQFFIKHNQLEFSGIFAEEARGLEAMAATGTIRVPAVVAQCTSDCEAILVLEKLDFAGSREGDWDQLGIRLARMHRATSAKFGWSHDNYLGSTLQQNGWLPGWVDFLRERRLLPQVRLARRNGLRLRQADLLLELLPGFFSDHSPEPSLLHGDLWGGNAGFLKDGSPVIYDPACYFGDREADLAMTEMFGGFSPRFHAAYAEAWPVHPDYPVRKHLYNLYHLLNHFNIFGGGYASQVESTIGSLIASVS